MAFRFDLFLPARPPWWCGGGASCRPQPDPLARWPAPVIAVRRARAAGGLTSVDYRAGRDRRDSASLRHWPWGARATVAAATAVTGRAFVTRPGGTGATVGAVIAVTWRAFVTRPGGDGGHRGRRDRRDRGNGIPARLRRGRRDDRGR
jgi:hypothetical protein